VTAAKRLARRPTSTAGAELDRTDFDTVDPDREADREHVGTAGDRRDLDLDGAAAARQRREEARAEQRRGREAAVDLVDAEPAERLDRVSQRRARRLPFRRDEGLELLHAEPTGSLRRERRIVAFHRGARVHPAEIVHEGGRRPARELVDRPRVGVRVGRQRVLGPHHGEERNHRQLRRAPRNAREQGVDERAVDVGRDSEPRSARCEIGRERRDRLGHLVIAARRLAAEVGVERDRADVLLANRQRAFLDLLRQEQEPLLDPVPVDDEPRIRGGQVGSEAATATLVDAVGVGEVVLDRYEQHERRIEDVEMVTEERERVAPVPARRGDRTRDDRACAVVAASRREVILEALREGLRVGEPEPERDRVPEDDEPSRVGGGGRAAALPQSERVARDVCAEHLQPRGRPQRVAAARVDMSAIIAAFAGRGDVPFALDRGGAERRAAAGTAPPARAP
jgi:hypothetical protein